MASLLSEWDIDDEAAQPTLLVLTELLTNAIEHADAPIRVSRTSLRPSYGCRSTTRQPSSGNDTARTRHRRAGAAWTIGIVAAFIGSFIAAALGYTNANGGIPWILLIIQIVVAVIQIVVAAIGVVIAANLYARRGGARP